MENIYIFISKLYESGFVRLCLLIEHKFNNASTTPINLGLRFTMSIINPRIIFIRIYSTRTAYIRI